MNKERFLNALALNLGYSRIVNDKRIAIKLDDSAADPIVVLNMVNNPHSFKFNASEDADAVWMKIQKLQNALSLEPETKEIIDAVHQAYIEANTNKF